MLRLRLRDVRLDPRFTAATGICEGDLAGAAGVTNTAIRRLLTCAEGTDEGWWGSWAEIAFTASRSKPYIVLPREVARLEAVTVCTHPIAVYNQFWEYLRFGNGRLPKSLCRAGCPFVTQTLSRNNTATFIDIGPAPQIISIYPTDPADVGKRVLVQGLDLNGNPVYSMDNSLQVSGIFATLALPFSNPSEMGVPIQWNFISGIQKDITQGDVQFFQVDPTTGAQVLVLTMQPSEQTAWYRRYYLDNLPFNCCGGPASSTCIPSTTPPPTICQTQVTAIAKLDFIPAIADTDYLLIQSQDAIIEELQCMRYELMDNSSAKSFAANHHRMAVGFLNGQINHYIGKNEVAVGFFPFGSARLECKKVGTLI